MSRSERTLPDGIAVLGPGVARRIDTLVAREARREDEQLAEALAVTLRVVPRPLRGLARKVLGA